MPPLPDADGQTAPPAPVQVQAQPVSGAATASARLLPGAACGPAFEKTIV